MNNLTSIFSNLAIIMSMLTFIMELIYHRKNYRNEEYNAFIKFWIEMDDIFINHPEIHKYFYDKKFIDDVPEDEKEKRLAFCIAERFRDVFQYSEEISYKIDKKYRESYYDYMRRIQNTKVYKIANALNPILYEKKTPIGYKEEK